MLDEDPEVTPKWRDQYVNAEILLLREHKIARGQVVHWKHDANGNPIGRSNQNPIMDTHLYDMEFTGGEMTELAANINAESMYTQCDIDWNKYLLLVEFINGSEKPLGSQQLVGTFVVNGKTDPHLERNYPTLKNRIQSRLWNIL